MDVTRDHVIHSRGGRLGDSGTSTIEDVERILEQAANEGSEPSLAIHFHGGLVSADSARGIADRLAPDYAAAGSYPIFFVWESGLIESLRNNLEDIRKDVVFRELVKKAAEWVLKRMGTEVATRGAGASVDEERLREEFNSWFEGESDEPPISVGPAASRAYVTRTVEPDEDDLATSIEAELENDEHFQEVFGGLYVASRRGTEATTRGGTTITTEVQSVMDDRALDELFPPTAPGSTKGLFSWFRVAKFVAKIAIAAIHRHLKDRDHGPYTTVVEEVLRAAYLDKVGEVVWRTIKKDTADAFGDDGACVGHAVLTEIAKLASEGKTFSRITLIGHSTGAIYIDEFIENAATLLPGTKFDVVLLAPANRFESFAQTITRHSNAVENFRMFAMRDELEQEDRLVSIIYPRSLLYFVSGVLEGTVDAPIVGMQRFVAEHETFDEQNFPAVAAVRSWFMENDARTVWSEDARDQGLGSESRKHGDFDNDAATVGSIKWILEKGY